MRRISGYVRSEPCRTRRAKMTSLPMSSGIWLREPGSGVRLRGAGLTPPDRQDVAEMAWGLVVDAGSLLVALAALGSVTVAVAVAGVTRAGGSVSRGASGAVTSAWPLSAGPVTSLPGPLVAMTPGDVTNGGEATLLALGTRAIWEVAIGASGMG